MKLFKKLAAVALAAVLAVSMVGCGKANSVNSTKQLVLDLMNDYAAVMSPDAEINNTAAMDGIAQNLLNKAAELYASEEQTDKSMDALMAAASAADGMGFEAGKTYMVTYAEDYQFKSSLVNDAAKQQIFFDNLMNNSFNVPSGEANFKNVDIGVATGKIGDKTYAVVVMTETPAAE